MVFSNAELISYGTTRGARSTPYITTPSILILIGEQYNGKFKETANLLREAPFSIPNWLNSN